MNKSALWILCLILLTNPSAAISQTVYELDIETGEQCSCRDIPSLADGYSGWLTNIALEERFRDLLRYKPYTRLGFVFIDGPLLWQYPVGAESVNGRIENRATRVQLNRGFVFFESGLAEILSASELAEISLSQADLMRVARKRRAQAIAYEEWTLNLHWELIHLGWHGTATRKITVLTATDGHQPVTAQPEVQGALCESYGINIRLNRVEILS